MKETEAIIERVRRINNEYQHLELAVDEALWRIKPGQSLLARPPEDEASWHPYLRERWWPVNIGEGKLVVERPSTESYNPGQLVNLIGLVGQPYRFRRTLRNVLLIAYETAPTPLLMTIPWLLSNKISVTLVLAGSARAYSTQHLAKEVEIVFSDQETDSDDDGLKWSNQVMTIGWADQVFVAVGQDDEYRRFKQVLEKFTQLRNGVPQNYLFGVYQASVPCGVGACQACMIQMLKGTHLACVDGPAFDLTQVLLS